LVGEGVLQETEGVLIGDVHCEFEAEGVDQLGEVRVQFQHLLVMFHSIINEQLGQDPLFKGKSIRSENFTEDDRREFRLKAWLINCGNIFPPLLSQI
jgi:hypothetical protein